MTELSSTPAQARRPAGVHRLAGPPVVRPVLLAVRTVHRLRIRRLV